ncbi:hypothetical protein DMN91_012621 [Ooceraea biroi]|uniref:Uncharacterized protein n=1 Tax=Ooceraea biroi TaxID=2015173 RepID=A0A3L8D3F3_OOCBI|nr:hypothetical protein DMN91_012621 [Ooceraea biroi]
MAMSMTEIWLDGSEVAESGNRRKGPKERRDFYRSGPLETWTKKIPNVGTLGLTTVIVRTPDDCFITALWCSMVARGSAYSSLMIARHLREQHPRTQHPRRASNESGETTGNMPILHDAFLLPR